MTRLPYFASGFLAAALIAGCGATGTTSSSTQTSPFIGTFTSSSTASSTTTVKNIAVSDNGAVTGTILTTTITSGSITSNSYRVTGTIDTQGNSNFHIAPSGGAGSAYNETGTLSSPQVGVVTGTLNEYDASTGALIGTDTYNLVSNG